MIRPVICHHPYPALYYMWDTVNMQTQKVSKVPPFDGIQHKSVRQNIPLTKIYANTSMHTNNHAYTCICMICTYIHSYTHTCLCTAIDIYLYVHAHQQQICVSISANVYSSTNDALEDTSPNAYRWLNAILLQYCFYERRDVEVYAVLAAVLAACSM